MYSTLLAIPILLLADRPEGAEVGCAAAMSIGMSSSRPSLVAWLTSAGRADGGRTVL